MKRILAGLVVALTISTVVGCGGDDKKAGTAKPVPTNTGGAAATTGAATTGGAAK